MKAVYLYIFVFLLFLPGVSQGAVERSNMRDTVPALGEGLRTELSDSTIFRKDTISTKKDTVPVRKSSLDAPVFSKGRDSTVYDFTGKDRMIYYYGDVAVNYGNREMKAEYMAYNVDSRIVFAEGVKDTTGKWVGSPVMKEGGSEYRMENVYYNFSSRKAKITNVITQEGDAYLHGDVIKKMPDNSINVHGGKYTTCDLDHPHFYLRLTKAKVVPEPNAQTVFGPAYLVIEDVPTPLVLPFGFFPKRNDRSGGFLFPTFGEEASRGFFVTGIGWYFVFGEYFDLALTADYYTLGSWGLHAVSRYKKMYSFDGTFNLQFAESVSGDPNSTDYSQSRNFSINWSHRQDPKANPSLTFNASVSFMTSSFRRYNSPTNPQNALQSNANSSISLAKNWEGTPFNLSVNATHSQNMQDSSYAITLPNFTFSMSTIYPFKRKRAVGKERFYEKISIGYNTTFDNKINFKESEVGQPDFWNKLTNGMKHNFSIGLPTFNVLKYITVSPTFNYSMNMYFQGLEKQYNDSTGRVEDIKSNAFSEFHVTNAYGFGISANTRLYGTFQFGRGAYIRAIRHIMSPSIGASFSPDLRTYANGYRTYYYVDNQGNPHSVNYNAYSGVYSAPSAGRTAALNFSLGNNLEMKVANKKDTTNGGETKLKIIDNLSLSGSYNFLADSMNLSTIGVSLSTNILGKVAVNANATLDPYAVSQGHRINKFALSADQGLMRLTTAGFSFGYQFKGGEKGFKNNPPTLDGVRRYDPETGDYLYTEYLFYQDFSAPWSFGFNYSFTYNVGYTKTANNEWIKQHNYIQSLGFNGQVKLTKEFDLSATSGFDFKNMQLTTTTFNIHYDMHCFEFAVGWTPFGQYQSWNFRFNAKSSMLADLLKYDKRTNYYVY